MDLANEKYIILEIIPTAIKDGQIIQLSALKIEGIKLIDRFDYRLNEELVPFPQMIDMFSYDKDSFTYVKSDKIILENFKKFIEDYKLLIIDNNYTNNYLVEFDNDKESVFKYLNEKYDDEVFNRIIKKYNLEPSNYLVDLLYESLIKEL